MFLLQTIHAHNDGNDLYLRPPQAAPANSALPGHVDGQRQLGPSAPDVPARPEYSPLSTNGQRRIQTRQLDEDDCGPGQCWASMYQMCLHITSQECKNPQPSKKPTVKPTPSPTQKPTFDIEITVHPVRVKLEGVQYGYKLTEDVRALIIRFATETIEADLEEPLELINVEFAGYFNGRHLSTKHRMRRLEDMSVPLKVTIKGPSNMSGECCMLLMVYILIALSRC